MPLFALWTALLGIPVAHGAEPSASAQPTPPAPIMGRCIGTVEAETPPAGGAPSDSLPQPWNDDGRREFESIGYKVEPGGKFLVGPGGAPVTKELVTWLTSAQDFSKIKVHYLDWAAMVTMGYDLDEARCVMTRDQTGDLQRVDYFVLMKVLSQGRQFAALEQMSARFGRVQGRLPPAAREELERLKGLKAGLPADLARKIRAGTATRADLLSAYESQARMFDAQADRAALTRAAETAPSGETPKPPTNNAEENALSARLGAQFSSLIGETAYGRELLAAFHSHGVSLPFIRIQRFAQKDGFMAAAYINQSRLMVMDHDSTVRQLMAGLPPDEQRRLAELLKTPADLRRYLAEHPDQMDKFARATLGAGYHELTHYFQSITTHFDDEATRGNAPGRYPIEYEHEAFRETCAFMSQRSLDHDYAATEWTELVTGPCVLLLNDYGRFADFVTQIYSKGYGASTLEDIRLMQELRRGTARKLMSSDEIVERLKLSGMMRGDDALHQLTLTVNERTAAFMSGKLPALRRMVQQQVIPRANAQDRPDVAVALLGGFPAGSPGFEDMLSRWLPAALPRFESPGDHFPLEYRMAGYQYAGHVLQREKREWPTPLLHAYVRDARQFTGNPNLSWGGLGTMPPDQPGLTEARAAWSDASVAALEKPPAEFTLPGRLGAYSILAQSYVERKKTWPSGLMRALERDLAESGGMPSAGAAVISALPYSQPGSDAATKAWLRVVHGALLTPKADFPLESRVVAWVRLAPLPPDLKEARERDAEAYARDLLARARAEADPVKRHELLDIARTWSSSAAGGGPITAEIERELKR